MYLKKLNEILKIFSISMNMKTFIVSKLYCVLLSIDDVAHAPDVGRRRIVCKWILATFPTVCQHSFVCLVGALWVHCHLFMTAAEMQTAFVILFLFFIFWKEKLHAFVFWVNYDRFEFKNVYPYCPERMTSRAIRSLTNGPLCDSNNNVCAFSLVWPWKGYC